MECDIYSKERDETNGDCDCTTDVSESPELAGYKDIDQITAKDVYAVEWLLKDKHNSLRADGLTDIVRLLLKKVGELTTEVNRLRFLSKVSLDTVKEEQPMHDDKIEMMRPGETQASGVPVDSRVMPCKHEFIFILGKDVPTGMYSQMFQRAHWCEKCGEVQISMASGEIKKRFKVKA